jgi:hypothetical protein
MDIIVLEGINSSGKTASLGMLYALMANSVGTNLLHGPTAIINVDTQKDFNVTLSYTGPKLGNKKIAIFTAGDSLTMIQMGIAYATSQNADILIVPNSTGKPSSTLYAQHRVIHTITKTPSALLPDPSALHATQLVENMKTAQSIEALL